MEIQKKFVTDENNTPLAVQIDIETFTKIEQVIEDYALGQLSAEVEENESLSLDAARAYYEQLPEEDNVDPRTTAR
jgi:hypothetical protein